VPSAVFQPPRRRQESEYITGPFCRTATARAPFSVREPAPQTTIGKLSSQFSALVATGPRSKYSLPLQLVIEAIRFTTDPRERAEREFVGVALHPPVVRGLRDSGSSEQLFPGGLGGDPANGK